MCFKITRQHEEKSSKHRDEACEETEVQSPDLIIIHCIMCTIVYICTYVYISFLLYIIHTNIYTHTVYLSIMYIVCMHMYMYNYCTASSQNEQNSVLIKYAKRLILIHCAWGMT